MKKVRLTTERLQVRDMMPRAAAKAVEFHRNNREFHGPWEPERPDRYYTRAEQRRILRGERRSDSMVHLWMFLRDSKTITGSITLSCIVRGYLHSCFLGYKIDQQFEGQGYMREALSAVIDYAFGDLALHRLEANVMPHNARSLELLRRLGFQEEGLARRYLQIAGRWEDHLHMVLLSDDRKHPP